MDASNRPSSSPHTHLWLKKLQALGKAYPKHCSKIWISKPEWDIWDMKSLGLILPWFTGKSYWSHIHCCGCLCCWCFCLWLCLLKKQAKTVLFITVSSSETGITNINNWNVKSILKTVQHTYRKQQRFLIYIYQWAQKLNTEAKM